jgi:predicted peroxiredoxin
VIFPGSPKGEPEREPLSTSFQEEKRMAKFLFVLSRGLEDPSRSTRCLQLAQIARQEGHEVLVFLVDDGVIFARKGMTENVVAPTGDRMRPYLDSLIQGGVPFYV